LYQSCRGSYRLPLVGAELAKASVSVCRDVLQGNENGSGKNDGRGLCGDVVYGPVYRPPFSCLGVGGRPLRRQSLLELEEVLSPAGLSGDV